MAGAAAPSPIDTIVELYSSQKACSKIFQPYLHLAEQDRLGRAFAAGEQAFIATSEAPADLGDRLRELGPVLLFPKYRSDGLRELLATYVPDITLADVWTERNRGIVTPSFQLSAVAPSGTRQWAARLLNNLPNVAWMSGTKVIDAILASAAAPVFFPPHELPRARRLAWVKIDRRTKHSVVRRLFAISRHWLQGEQLSAA